MFSALRSPKWLMSTLSAWLDPVEEPMLAAHTFEESKIKAFCPHIPVMPHHASTCPPGPLSFQLDSNYLCFKVPACFLGRSYSARQMLDCLPSTWQALDLDLHLLAQSLLLLPSFLKRQKDAPSSLFCLSLANICICISVLLLLLVALNLIPHNY